MSKVTGVPRRASRCVKCGGARRRSRVKNGRYSKELCQDCIFRYILSRTFRRLPSHATIVFLRAEGRCVYCGRALLWSYGKRSGKHDWGVDHVVPRGRGDNTLTNKAAACIQCGSTKGARTPEEWEEAKSGT